MIFKPVVPPSTRSLTVARHRSTAPRRAATLATAIALVVVCWPEPSQASRPYAYALSTGFGFGGGCPACHNNLAGGLGTVTKPFGTTMRRLGLKADDTNSLYEALTALQSSNIDSDGDTIADFDELAPNGDPNNPDVFPPDATPVPSPSSMPGTPTTSPEPSTPSEPSQNPSPTSAPGATTQPPASTTSPESSTTDARSNDDGGCALLPPSPRSPGALGVLLLLGWALVRRRRRADSGLVELRRQRG